MKQSHDYKKIASLPSVARDDNKARMKVFFGRTLISYLLLFVVIFDPPELIAHEYFQLHKNPRIRYTINEDWKFYPNGIAFGQRDKQRGIKQHIDDIWESVCIPHTWNAHDPFDDLPSYRRGISWYRKEIYLDESLKNKRLFLYFEGVNQVADVFINGAFVGRHKGGYSAFAFEITEFVEFDGKENHNLIAVQVNNSHDISIPPLSVGYALYGGIYRDVWLIATNPVHIKVLDYASSGVYITTPKVTPKEALINIRGTIVNRLNKEQRVRVVNTILNSSGKIVQQLDSQIFIGANKEIIIAQTGDPIKNPRLWSPDDPYLYSVYTEVFHDNQLVDRVKNPLGFRWFSFDPDSGFYLNGRKLQIKGTNRHQDYKGLGDALPNSQHRKDLEWIKNMGANFVRLAHYPQDPAVLETADWLGLLVWEEIPLVNYMNISKEFLENTKTMLSEMIRQHYNHPSVIIWGSMNEIFLWNKNAKRAGTIDDPEYMQDVHNIALSLDSLIRSEDPTRYTAMAFHGSNDYQKAGIDTIPQIQGWNVYYGWYGGKVEQFGKWLDKKHIENSNSILFISEYGAGGDVRLNAMNPKRFDFTGNYQRYYHESYLRQIKDRPFLAGAAIWNQFDFSQPHTGGSIPHLNQKGMQTWDRKPKDVYFLYKANWNPEPMVHIASHDWTTRISFGDRAASDLHSIDVYSNLECVELFCNGKSLGVKRPDEIKKASWKVQLNHGNNIIEAKGQKDGHWYQDLLILQCKYFSNNLADTFTFTDEVAINVGYNAEFVEESALVWLPDQLYREGSYGHLGGKPAMIEKDLIVLHSGHRTPIYNYYLSGLDSYRLDVPDGEYEVELYFAEPEDLEINMRVFNVLVNGQPIIRGLDLAQGYGFVKAASKCFIVTAANESGIQIEFEKIKGKPILNALRVRKL